MNVKLQAKEFKVYKLVNDLRQPGQGEASVAQLARCIFWSFFGVRKGKDHGDDAAKISPMQLIFAGIVGTIILHGALFATARFAAGPQAYDAREVSEYRELSLKASSPITAELKP